MIPVYVFSNTYMGEFRDLCVPSDEKLAKQMRLVAFSDELEELTYRSPLILFAKRIDDQIFVGARLHVSILNELSSRYYYVARCRGTTLTEAAIVFAVPINKFMIVNKGVLTAVLRTTYLKKIWYGTDAFARVRFQLEMNDEAEIKLNTPLWRKTKYYDIDEMFYNFNAEIQKNRKCRKFQITFSLIKNYRYMQIETIKDRHISLQKRK